MAERSATDLLNLRLPLYAYTAPLWTGRRVLEIGCDDGDSARYLATQGADRVVVIDSDLAQIERARTRFSHPKVDYRPATDLRQMGVLDELFDFIIVPDGRSLVGNRNLLLVLRRILSAGGHIMISVVAAERRTPAPAEGIGYYELVDALEGQFPVVRMLGRTPFLGFGLVEFDSAADALRVDATLLDGKAEPPTHYVAIAGKTAPAALGYALVQVPFEPIERLLHAAPGAGGRPAIPDEVARRLQAGEQAAEEARTRLANQNAEIARLLAKVSQLTVELETAETNLRALTDRTTLAGASKPAGPAATPVAAVLTGGLDAVAAATRAELAERRLEESEHRGRARVEELENRVAELRRKLDEALVQAESAMRVARVQGDEMDELRARLRRATEDRVATDGEMTRLRRALLEADEAVLSLTRKTAEQMAAVAHQIATGLRASVATAPGGDATGAEQLAAVREELAQLRVNLAEAVRRASSAEREREQVTRGSGQGGVEPGASMAVALADAEERVRVAERAVAHERAEAVELGRRLQGAEEQIRGLSQRAALVSERDARIARLEGDKQDLVWRVAELEEKHRHAVEEASVQRPVTEDIQVARAGRDRAIAELHRAAAAHASEVSRLRASVDEQAALVVELEDSLRAAEARAAAADKEASTLRRNAKALEEADRTRRGRLAELEGKLLRLEREKSLAAAAGAGPGRVGPAGPGAGEEAERRLGAMEQRALAAEQRAVGLDERLAAAERQAEAAAEARRTVTAEGPPAVPELESPLESGVGARVQNGTHGLPDAAEIQAAIEDVEEQLRQELRMLTAIEDTLTRARDQVARSVSASLATSTGTTATTTSTPPAPGERTDFERAIASKDAQLIETRLELSRLRRESEERQAGLEREINDLRTRLAPQSGGGAGAGTDSALGATGQGQSTQLILMHTTLANIRRRAARLRDELEGFRRRLDSLPPGALSSLLEEIGEDLGEFAK